MPSTAHEALVQLFRNRPALGAELLKLAAPSVVPRYREARLVSADRTEAQPMSRSADVVVELTLGRATRSAIVVEVQLRKDAEKRYTWPLYAASVRADLRCPVTLLVIAPSAAVARWARTPIHTGQPGNTFVPVVIGSAEVPVVINRAVARAHPELAVLSAMAHGRGEQGFEVSLAAFHAVGYVDEVRSQNYTSFILAAMSEAMRRKLEEEMRLGNYPEPTRLEKKILARGEARGEVRGRAEGRTEGEARAVLSVLEARGIKVQSAVRKRVTSCTDLAMLERWLVRAASAAKLDDVFG